MRSGETVNGSNGKIYSGFNTNPKANLGSQLNIANLVHWLRLAFWLLASEANNQKNQ